ALVVESVHLLARRVAGSADVHAVGRPVDGAVAEARRPGAREAAERRDDQARMLGDGDAASLARIRPGLEQGVALEVVHRLLRVDRAGDLVGAAGGDDDGCDLAYRALIAGNEELHDSLPFLLDHVEQQSPRFPQSRAAAGGRHTTQLHCRPDPLRPGQHRPAAGVTPPQPWSLSPSPPPDPPPLPPPPPPPAARKAGPERCALR